MLATVSLSNRPTAAGYAGLYVPPRILFHGIVYHHITIGQLSTPSLEIGKEANMSPIYGNNGVDYTPLKPIMLVCLRGKVG
jgi:hypothetical protein